MRRLAAVFVSAFVSCLACGAPAHAQVEWFPEGAMSHATARAHATVADATDDRCSFASAREPGSCPWCRQFDRCRKVPLGPGTGATSDDTARADAQRLPRLDATAVAAARHGLEFRPDGFSLDIDTNGRYENRGTAAPGNRVIGAASGQAYLRIPSGTTLEYEFSGRMEWTPGSSGASIQLIGVPNTGAALSEGFAFQSLHQPGGSPSELKQSGRLTPGTYRLIWSVGVDAIGRRSTEEARMTASLRTRRPVAGWPQCPGPTPAPPLSRQPWSADSMSSHASREPAASRPMTPATRPLRPDRSQITNPSAPLVDIDLGIDLYWRDYTIWKSAFPSMRREALQSALLPIASCVVAAHGNPDAIWYRNKLYVPPAELAKLIIRRCGFEEPVVLLACNSGRPKVDGAPNYAQQLSAELRRAGRPNADVWAPNAYVSASGRADSEFETRPDGGWLDTPKGTAPTTTGQFVLHTTP